MRSGPATAYAFIDADLSGCRRDRSDLGAEPAGVEGRCRPSVRFQGELVELSPGDVPLLGNLLGAGALVWEFGSETFGVQLVSGVSPAAVDDPIGMRDIDSTPPATTTS